MKPNEIDRLGAESAPICEQWDLDKISAVITQAWRTFSPTLLIPNFHISYTIMTEEDNWHLILFG